MLLCPFVAHRQTAATWVELANLDRICLFTQRRAIERNLPPGSQRDAWLSWLTQVEAEGRIPISDRLRELMPSRTMRNKSLLRPK